MKHQGELGELPDGCDKADVAAVCRKGNEQDQP